MVRIAPVVAFAVCALPVFGQLLHEDASVPSFEVATIKPYGPSTRFFGSIAPLGTQDVVHLVGTKRMLIATAYNVPTAKQLVDWSGPDDSKMYVVEAKISEQSFAQMQTMDPSARTKQVQWMLQSLLADRLRLKVHFAMQGIPVYELVLDKHGSKLPEPNDPSGPAGQGWTISPKGEMRVRNMKLDELLESPVFELDRPVINKTGLTGRYNLKLHWMSHHPGMAGTDGFALSQDSGPSIFTVVEEDLGLKLVAAKGPVEVLYVDHIEQPSEN